MSFYHSNNNFQLCWVIWVHEDFERVYQQSPKRPYRKEMSFLTYYECCIFHLWGAMFYFLSFGSYDGVMHTTMDFTRASHLRDSIYFRNTFNILAFIYILFVHLQINLYIYYNHFSAKAVRWLALQRSEYYSNFPPEESKVPSGIDTFF